MDMEKSGKSFKKGIIIIIVAVILAAVALTLVLTLTKKPAKASLSFDTNGGSVMASVELQNGAEYVLPTGLEREGYLFEGWYDNAQFSGSPVEKVTVNGNATYYVKWTQLYAVNLNSDGGTGVPSVVYLKDGANVSEAIAEYVPTKTGLVFGAWFNGNNELGKFMTMEKKPLDLTAKYKVEYTVKMYEQNLGDDGYTEVPSATGLAYVGETYAPEVARTGFELADSQANVTSIQLSADKAQNVYSFYFDRKTFNVNFFANYAGNETSVRISAKYGEEIEIPYESFNREGYYIKGWSTARTGDVEIESAHLDVISRNGDASDDKDFMTVTDTLSLYCVWEQAYTNMFGGKDYLFVPDTDGNVAYIYRGGVYFKGKYSKYENEATFRNDANKLVITCRLNPDHTYVYEDSSREEREYYLYGSDDAVDRKTSVRFDSFNGIIYTENRSTANQQLSRGTYLKNADDDYVITFTSGPHEGENMIIRLSSSNIFGASDIFRIRNDEEKNLGDITRCTVYSGAERPDLYGKLVVYNSYELTLSGFGTAQINTPNGNINYSYKKDGDVITLTNSITSEVSVVKLINLANVYGYIYYNEELDGEFLTSDEENAEKLSLDGTYNAVYTDKNGDEHEGLYSVENSVFGGYIVTVYADGEVMSFLIKKNVETSGGEVIGEGTEEAETVTTYELQVKNSGYAEFYLRYKDTNSSAPNTYIAPVLVLNDNGVGDAGFYGFPEESNDRIYVRIMHGEFSETENGVYELTNLQTDLVTEKYGILNIYDYKSMTFACESYSGYNVYYLISAVNKENEEKGGLSATYVSGDDKLVLSDAGFFVAFMDDKSYHGTFEKDGVYVTAMATDLGVVTNFYFKLDGDSFTQLYTVPYNIYVIDEQWNGYDENTYIALDGSEFGASYYVNGVKLYDGTMEKTGETSPFDSSVPVYIFTSDDYAFSFSFIRVYFGMTNLYSPYDEDLNGSFYSDQAQLELDGYGYRAEFTDEDGTVYGGRYFVYEENVIVLEYGNGTFYFDVDGIDFTKRGTEYGTYAFTDNHSLSGVMVTLDGYGKATVFMPDGDEGNKTYIDENATYEIDEDGFITVKYSTEGGSVEYVGKFGILKYTVSGEKYGEIATIYEEVVMSYVDDDDWTILTLEDNGSATLYDSKGNVQKGTYVLITDDLLYFEDIADVENGYLFNYSVAQGSISPVRNSSHGYYTKDLESLIFSKAGFAIFNNEETYYYTVDNDEITLYKKDASDPAASKYGFVEVDFGRFESQMEYNGKIYNANNGYSIAFMRKESDKNEEGKFIYLLPTINGKEELTELSFAPTGERTFEGVEGTAKIGDTDYTCYVYRQEDEETHELTTYAVIGYFYIYLEGVEFEGVDMFGNSLSSFSVTAVKRVIDYNSYRLIDGFYRVYVTQGYAAARRYLQNDQYGILSMVYEYDEDGEVVTEYVNADFGELSELYDYDGNIVKLDHAEYEVSDNVYRVTLGGGGYVYYLYFGMLRHNMVGSTGYYIYAYTREETLTTADGEYRVTVERYVYSDNESRVMGSYMQVSMAVKTDETDGSGKPVYEKLAIAGGVTHNGEMYLIYRVHDEAEARAEGTSHEKDTVPERGKLIESKYYKVEFEEEDGDVTVGSEDEVHFLKAVTVTEIVNDVYVSEDGKSFLEVPKSGDIIILVYEGTTYFVDSYEFEDQTYTLNVYGGNTFTVTLQDGVAVFEKQGSEEGNPRDVTGG